MHWLLNGSKKTGTVTDIPENCDGRGDCKVGKNIKEVFRRNRCLNWSLPTTTTTTHADGTN